MCVCVRVCGLWAGGEVSVCSVCVCVCGLWARWRSECACVRVCGLWAGGEVSVCMCVCVQAVGR